MPYTAKRHANIRARTPEPIPVRFPARGVREQNPLLAVQSLLARTIEHPCGWKGCGAVLASEELSRKHVHYRDHAFEGRMAGQVGHYKMWLTCRSRRFGDACGTGVACRFFVRRAISRSTSRQSTLLGCCGAHSNFAMPRLLQCSISDG